MNTSVASAVKLSLVVSLLAAVNAVSVRAEPMPGPARPTTTQPESSRTNRTNRTRPTTTQPGSQMVSIPLTHANPVEALEFIKCMVPTSQVILTPNPRTHSIYVSAYGEFAERTVEQIREAVALIDVPIGPDPDEPQVRLIRLKTPITEAVQDLAKMTVGARGEVAVDPTRNTIIIRAPRDVMMSTIALLQQLEDIPLLPTTRPEQAGWDIQQVRVRLVWLAYKVDGVPNAPSDAKLLGNPPADLKSVLDELKSIGVSEPKLIAQTIVTSAKGKFEIRGSAGPGNRPAGLYNLSVSGEIHEIPDERNEEDRWLREVQLEVKVQRDGTPSCQISTKLTVPLKHAVVLGTAPIDDLNSVFVFQLLPAD